MFYFLWYLTGCGASCIYPLLGAQMNGWNFLASEVDALAIYYAKENITRNGLDDKITGNKALFKISMLC